jgi:heptaprenylglyceryl phosphate synthase
MFVYQKLLNVRDQKGAGFLVVLDPDRMSVPEIVDLARKSEQGGADGFLVGSSVLLSTGFDEAVADALQDSTISDRYRKLFSFTGQHGILQDPGC